MSTSKGSSACPWKTGRSTSWAAMGQGTKTSKTAMTTMRIPGRWPERMMRRRTRLHRDHASRLIGQQCNQARPRQRTIVNDHTSRPDRADLEAALRQVDCQHADLAHRYTRHLVPIEPSWHTRCRWVGASTASVQG